MDNSSVEMPKYKCHKQVWALQIKEINGNSFTPLESGYAPIELSDEFILKHNPHAGGFYVVYEDGYKSFSPAEAFMNGYSLI